MAKFEQVNRLKHLNLPLPKRSTTAAAGYDFVVAEDTIIPPYCDHMLVLLDAVSDPSREFTLSEIEELTKGLKTRPTLVPTGMKCQLAPNQYLELSTRSSSPYKAWLVLANGVGIIDADYYNNEYNEGEIFFQIINFTPFTIKLHQGERIGQGIIKTYDLTEDDITTEKRSGGFGSTGE